MTRDLKPSQYWMGQGMLMWIKMYKIKMSKIWQIHFMSWWYLPSSQYWMGHDARSAAASVKALPHGHCSHHWITDRFPERRKKIIKLKILKMSAIIGSPTIKFKNLENFSCHWITDKFPRKPNWVKKIYIFKRTKPVAPQIMKSRSVSMDFATRWQPLTGTALGNMLFHPFSCLKLVDFCTVQPNEGPG